MNPKRPKLERRALFPLAAVLLPMLVACAGSSKPRIGLDRIESSAPLGLEGLSRFTWSGTGVDFAACPTDPDSFRKIRLAGYDTLVVSLSERESWPREDVEKWARANGLRYFWIPLGREPISREAHLEAFEKALAGAGKALLTCASGTRVKALWACWMQEFHRVPAREALDRAVRLGLRGGRLKQAKTFLGLD